MTTERIDIVIREDGSRVVKRSLDDIGASADRAAKPVDLLKRVLALLGGGLVAREVFRMVESFTSLQNRLRSTGLEGDRLQSVYQRLLAVSNDTRSSVEGSVELYSRLAISSKELGVTQSQLIDFTKSLNQAITLSGASAQEAQAGLIQLSQGLASGTLRGDELRSVLEQLPAVADVIAKQLGVTRGELRALGEQGKITARTVIDAFKNSKEALEEAFKNTVPTIGQSFQVLRNQVLDFFGQLDKQLGVSQAISKALLAIAGNLDSVADAVKRATIAALTFASAYGAVQLALRADALVVAARAALEYSRAVAAGTVVTLGSAQAERARLATLAAGAAAQVAASTATAAASAAAAVEEARSASVSVNAAALRANAAAAATQTLRAGTIAKLQGAQADIAAARASIAASEAAGAQSFALATLRTAREALTASEARHAVLLRELAVLDARGKVEAVARTEALAAQTVAQEALNRATAGAAAAQATQAAAAAKAAQTAQAAQATQAAVGVSLLAQAYGKLKSAVGTAFDFVTRFFGLLNRNPLTVLITALVVVTGLLFGFGDKVNAGIDGITTLRDVAQATGEALLRLFSGLADVAGAAFSAIAAAVGPAFAPIINVVKSVLGVVSDAFSDFYAGTGEGFAGVVRAIARTFDGVAGIITGTLLAIIRAFTGLPAVAVEAFNRLYNGSVEIIEKLLNVTIAGINKARSLVGLAALDLVQFTKLKVDEKAFEKYGESIANSIKDGFEMQGGFLETAVVGVFDRAAQIALDRELQKASDLALAQDYTTETPGTPKNVVDPAELKKAQSAYESLLGAISPVDAAVREQAQAFETLRVALSYGIINQKQYSDLVQKARDYYRDAIDPLGKLNRELGEQTSLLMLNSREREVEAQVLQATNELKRQGKVLSKDEIAALRERLSAFQAFNEAAQIQDQLLANSVEKRRQFVLTLNTINKLLNDPNSGYQKSDAVADIAGAFNEGVLRGTLLELQASAAQLQTTYDKIQALKDQNLIGEGDAERLRANARIEQQSQIQQQSPELFEGTQEQLDLQVARFQQMYAQVDALRSQDLVSEQTAAMMKARIDIKQQEQRLANTQGFFGNLAQLSRSGNSKLAAIGKAAAIAQATIDGILAVQKALASAPPPVNYVLAAAVGAAAAANVASIAQQGKGFESGGYTGNMGTKQVAGVVHGQEFVVNAQATARNRAALEAMNSGQDYGGGNSGGTVVIVNNNANGTKTEVQERQTPTGREIEVLIEDVVVRGVRRGGRIADAMEGQFGLNRAVGTVR